MACGCCHGWYGGTAPGLRSGRVVLETPRRAPLSRRGRIARDQPQHLEPFEPQWASDELTRSAFRRRLKRYGSSVAGGYGAAFLVFRATDDAMLGGVTLSNIRRGVTQSASVGYWIGIAFRAPGYASEALIGVLGTPSTVSACIVSKPRACPPMALR